jgi:hypothetical protein
MYSVCKWPGSLLSIIIMGCIAGRGMQHPLLFPCMHQEGFANMGPHFWVTSCDMSYVHSP